MTTAILPRRRGRPPAHAPRTGSFPTGCATARGRFTLRPSTQISSTASRQSGMGMVGFLATAIPVIWLGLGGVELAHWMQLRQTLSLILMDAARAGSTHQAQPGTLARIFEQGLRRAYPAQGEVERILHRRRQDLGVPWHIAVQLPSRAAFDDHADPTLAAADRSRGRQPMIRNDHQAAQHGARLAQGWPQGRGPQSGLTIHEANTLKIALHWPHRPLFPGAGTLMKTLAPLSGDTRNRQWMAQGYLPFRRTVTVAMHSHPAVWPDLPDGRVTHESSFFQGGLPGAGGIPPPPPGARPAPGPAGPGSASTGDMQAGEPSRDDPLHAFKEDTIPGGNPAQASPQESGAGQGGNEEPGAGDGSADCS